MITRGNSAVNWTDQLPPSGSFTGQCSFNFSPDDTTYDWLVVIDDVSRKFFSETEVISCADEHTLLVTTEPPSITNYGTSFCAQFAKVLTSHPVDALKHPNRINSHTGSRWYNGHTYNELNDKSFPEKLLPLSTVCSSKQQKHTIHNDRYLFSHWLTQQLPSLDLFGHGSNYIKKKYDALDSYRFHLAIENYRGLHHWTEKIADPFLSGCLPIYYGCTNLTDYFPKESFVEIDIFNREKALEIVRETTEKTKHDSTTLDALYEARRLVLNEYNLLHMIEKLALKSFDPSRKSSGRRIYNRKQIRFFQPSDALRHAAWLLKRYTG